MRSALNRLWVFTVRDLLVHRGRTTASVAVVVVSTALLVAVLSVISSIDHSIDRLAAGIGGDSILEVSGASDGGFPASVRDSVAAVPGVATAVPLIQTSVTSPAGPVLLLGTDISATELNSSLQSELSGAGSALAGVQDGVLVGSGTGFSVGDTFALQNTTVTVAAVLDSESSSRFNGGRYVLAPLALAQQVASKAGYLDSVLIVGEPGVSAESLTPGVSAAVDGRAVVSASSAEQTKSSNGVTLIRFVAISAASMAFLVSGFLIYTAMGMALSQRRPIISMMRAVGGKRSGIVGDLLLESVVLAIVGGALGSALGVFLGRITIGRLPDLFVQAVTAEIEFSPAIWVIPVAVAVAVVICLIAAALAARAIYRVSPVEALVPVGVSTVDAVRPRTRIGAGIVGVVLGAMAFYIATQQSGIAANLGISTMFGAEILLGFALAVPIVRAAALLTGLFGSVGTLAAESIRRSPTRVWATLMTVAVAVAVTFTVTAGNANAVDSTKDSFAALEDVDIWISTSAAGEFPTGPMLPADLPARIGALPGVSKVVEEQAGYVALGDQRAMVFGLAPGAASPMTAVVDTAVRETVDAGDGVIVSRDLAASLELGVGDQLLMQTPAGTRAAPILATVPFFSALNGAVSMSLPQMQDWFGRAGASELEVHLDPGSDVERSLASVRAQLPAGVSAYTGAAAVAGFGESLDQATVLNNMLSIIVIVIAGVALLNTLLLSVIERRRELGVLRAVGASGRFSTAMILAEAAGIAIVGGALGLIFGTVQQRVSDYASSQAWNVDVRFVPVPLAFVFAAGALALCLLGALPPAFRAARMNIIEAIGAR
ncbi:putative ABC transport system permease protein [Rhodococcus sp. 27YEA15]|uniref:FtsX-like permease family protein n=1 Tax=Rhodococcus sp. 27YEA15 TaxID=3156259 RepID=UPI003C7BA77A